MSGIIGKDREHKSGKINTTLLMDASDQDIFCTNLNPSSIAGVNNTVTFHATSDGDQSAHNYSLLTTTPTELPWSRISITPSSTTSAIEITWAVQDHINQLTQGGVRNAWFTLARNQSDTGQIVHGMRVNMAQSKYTEHSSKIIHIDSPASTSTIEYSLFGNGADAETVYYQHAYAGVHDARIWAREILAPSSGAGLNWDMA
tara:strand:- start:464 stop:1069 length:606 start_codon:yes stop_codon:yes gene_type:complete